MEIIERPNMRAVHYLNSIKFKDFKQDCLDDAKTKQETIPKEPDIKAKYSFIKQFCKTHIKTKGETCRVYSHTLNTPKGIGGRLFCGGSAQGISNKYRGVLFNGITTDVDMKNAHPVILRWICKKHNIPCPHLSYYVENRDQIINNTKFFKTKAIGKKAFLVSTNDDKPLKDKKNKPKVLQDYDAEMKTIQKQLAEYPEYKGLIDSMPTEKRESNFYGSAINRIMCYYENIILHHAIHIQNKNNLEIAILMCDGNQIYCDHYQNTGLLQEITDYVNEQMPDLNMEWTYKKHDTSITIPADFDETNYKTANSEIPWLELTESYYAKMLSNVCFENKKILTTGLGKELEVFQFTGVYWKPLPLHNADLMKDNFDVLYNYLKNELELVGFEEKEYSRYLNQLKALQTNINQVNIIKLFKNMHYTDNVEFNKNANLFVFENAVYDLALGQKQEIHNPEDYMSSSCGYDYIDGQNSEIREDIEKFVNGLFDLSIVPFVWKVLACFLKQENTYERAYFFLGEGRNGKGTLTTLLNNALGKYWGELPVDYYTSCVKEADRPNQALYNCRNSRVLNTSEVNNKGQNNSVVKFLDGKFKVLTGRDTITARKLGTINIAYFKPGIPLIQLNQMPEFTGSKKTEISLKERISVVPFQNTFVNADDERLNTLPTFKQKDTGLKTKFDSLEYRQEMVKILFEKYAFVLKEGVNIPPLVAEHTNSYFDSLGILPWFKDNYEFTGNDFDRVALEVVKDDYINYTSKTMSIRELREELNSLNICCVHKKYSIKQYKYNIINETH